MTESDAVAALIQQRSLATACRLLVALVGVPGAGKSTVAAALAGRTPGPVGVPMDGYDLPRAALRPTSSPAAARPIVQPQRAAFGPRAVEGIVVRRIPRVRRCGRGTRPGGMVVRAGAPLVIVEGLYLLLRGGVRRAFRLLGVPGLRPGGRGGRLAARHLAAGLAATPTRPAAGRRRTLPQRQVVIDDGRRERADSVVGSEPAEEGRIGPYPRGDAFGELYPSATGVNAPAAR